MTALHTFIYAVTEDEGAYSEERRSCSLLLDLSYTLAGSLQSQREQAAKAPSNAPATTRIPLAQTTWHNPYEVFAACPHGAEW